MPSYLRGYLVLLTADYPHRARRRNSSACMQRIARGAARSVASHTFFELRPWLLLCTKKKGGGCQKHPRYGGGNNRNANTSSCRSLSICSGDVGAVYRFGTGERKSTRLNSS